MAAVEREHPAAVALGAGCDERVRDPETEIGIPGDQLSHTRYVTIAAVERQRAALEIAEDPVDGPRGASLVCEVAELADYRGGNESPPTLGFENPTGRNSQRLAGDESNEGGGAYRQPCQGRARSS